jgi:hypothetical protein
MTASRFSVAVVALTLAFAGAALPAAPRFSDWSAPVNLGGVINSAFAEFSPAVSRDRLTLYFGSDRPGGFGRVDLWVSKRASVDSPWESPINLGPVINTVDQENDAALSRDGHWLFFNSTRPGGFGATDLWVSWRAHIHDDFGWQPPVNMGAGVNSPFNDGNATYFENEDAGVPLLFFSSDRPATLGGGNIYVSELLSDGSFGPATLVVELSSHQADSAPSIRFDGLELFFFSNRPGSILNPFGLPSQDLWTSTRSGVFEPWTTPTNLGPLVNSSVNDIHPEISADREALYFNSNRPGGFGMADLYVTMRSKQSEP